jgi:hypothetical protein
MLAIIQMIDGCYLLIVVVDNKDQPIKIDERFYQPIQQMTDD